LLRAGQFKRGLRRVPVPRVAHRGIVGQNLNLTRGPDLCRYTQKKRLAAIRALGPIAAWLGRLHLEAVSAVRASNGHAGTLGGEWAGAKAGGDRPATQKGRSQSEGRAGRIGTDRSAPVGGFTRDRKV
jgi:hypothetical protein